MVETLKKVDAPVVPETGDRTGFDLPDELFSGVEPAAAFTEGLPVEEIPPFSSRSAKPTETLTRRVQQLWAAAGAIVSAVLVLSANPQPFGVSAVLLGLVSAVCGGLGASLVLSFFMDVDS